jgi:hypothetical protein
MPAAQDNYRLLEFNNPAGFADHHHPWRGRSRDVAGAILDYLARPDGPAPCRSGRTDKEQMSG